MHKKISVGLCVTIAIITLVITAIITTVITMNIYTNLVANLPERENMYDDLSEADNIIRSNYYGELNQDDINNAISNGYLESLSQGINYRMSAEDYESYKLRISGKDKDGNAVKTVQTQTYNGVGYIKITDFADTTPTEFKSALDNFTKEAVNGIIVDVRDTNSINIDAAAEMIDFIVPLATHGTKSIATAVDKAGNNTKIFAADSQSCSIPISVLVNEKTTGAGELFACDIRDFGKGTITGKTTAGNGTYQQIFELSDGGAIVLSVAKLMPYTSECYEGKGVKPDYEAEQKSSADKLENDSQFLKAYSAVMALT